MKIIDQARVEAIEVLKTCARPQGFFASGLPGGYEAVWARDSMMTSLGAVLIGDDFKTTVEKSLDLLTKNQTELGLVPNCVGSYNLERRSDVTFNSVDAPLWYIIGHHAYAQGYDDKRLLKKHWLNLAKALIWLKYQDPNNDKLIVSQPTADWMDAFPHKYGRVLHNLALYYAALHLMGEAELAEYIKHILNGETQKYLTLYDDKLGYYRPWAWKDHDGDRESEEWFDTTANLLAIVTGLATPAIAKKILTYIETEKIDQPFPCKAIWPPLKPGDKAWKSYFEKCDARTPYHYLNAGIWPFIGGLYVAALVKAKQFKKAEAVLAKLAEANLQKLKTRDITEAHGFNEWLDGKSGKPKGEPHQAWSAGMYLYAYECVKQKKVLFFK